MSRAALATLLIAVAGCKPTPTSRPVEKRSVIPLPGGSADGLFMDYLLFDPRTNTVWAPAGGAVDVIDVPTGKVQRIEGFATRQLDRHALRRVVGPSSATLGPPGTVYVGNRADQTVCAIDEKALKKGTCGKLDAMPDGIAYVETTKEVWVTTPRDSSIRIFDATSLVEKTKLEFDGEPEGFAPDLERGRFYTNLEDKDRTLAIDLVSHQTVGNWHPACGGGGPHGLRLATEEGVLLVACDAQVKALDAAHDGAVVGSVDTGEGVDDLDYAPASHLVYAAAAKAGTLAVAKLEAKGKLTLVKTVPTAQGARNGVVASDGAVYVAHPQGAELVVVRP